MSAKVPQIHVHTWMQESSALLTGTGMDIKYKSVTTFNTNVKNKSYFDMAGWQWSLFNL